jgi:hypothetical protein
MFRDFFDQEVNRLPLLDRACEGIPLGDCNAIVAQEVLKQLQYRLLSGLIESRTNVGGHGTGDFRSLPVGKRK